MEELQSKKIKVKKTKNIEKQELVEVVKNSTESLKETMVQSNEKVLSTFCTLFRDMTTQICTTFGKKGD